MRADARTRCAARARCVTGACPHPAHGTLSGSILCRAAGATRPARAPARHARRVRPPPPGRRPAPRQRRCTRPRISHTRACTRTPPRLARLGKARCTVGPTSELTMRGGSGPLLASTGVHILRKRSFLYGCQSSQRETHHHLLSKASVAGARWRGRAGSSRSG